MDSLHTRHILSSLMDSSWYTLSRFSRATLTTAIRDKVPVISSTHFGAKKMEAKFPLFGLGYACDPLSLKSQGRLKNILCFFVEVKSLSFEVP